MSDENKEFDVIENKTEELSSEVTQQTEILPEESDTTEKVSEQVVTTPQAEQVTSTPNASEQKTAQIVEKVKVFFANKRNVGIVAGVVAVVMLIFFLMNGPKSIVNDVQVKFSGYDERGTLSYNDVEVKAKIAQIVAEKHGIKVDTSNVSNTFNSIGDVAKNLLSGNTDYYKKLGEIQKYVSEINIKFDKTTNLKNGDTVTMTIVTGKDSPIKSETKTFTVSGLSPVEKINLQDIQKASPVNYTGYNGYGVLKFDTSVYTIKEAKQANLKNGQKITVTIQDGYIESLLTKGKVFDGPKTTTVEIKGLKELKAIKNIAEVYKQVGDLAKAKYANEVNASHQYTIEKKNDFMKYTPSTSGNSTITVVSVYKVNDKYKWYNEEKVEDYYVVVGYNRLEMFEESIILADIQYKTYSQSSKYTTLDSANAYLRSQGFIEYKK